MSIHETVWAAPSWTRSSGLDSLVELTVKSVTAKRIALEGNVAKTVDREALESVGWVWVGADTRPGLGGAPIVIGLTRDDCRRGVAAWHRKHSELLDANAARHANTADEWDV